MGITGRRQSTNTTDLIALPRTTGSRDSAKFATQVDLCNTIPLLVTGTLVEAAHQLFILRQFFFFPYLKVVFKG